MATTSIVDIITPKKFLKYQRERSVALSRFVQSGIAAPDPRISTRLFDQGGDTGGKYVELPFFQSLTGDREIIKPGTDLTPGKITTAQDRAIIHNSAKAWSVEDLAHLFAGEDPMRAIADFTVDWWLEQEQKLMLSLCKGVFASGDLAANLFHIHHTTGGAGSGTSANVFTAENFIAAKQKLGDAKGLLTAMAVHSATEASMEEQDLITTEKDSETGAIIKSYKGLELIIDDSMPTATVDGDLVYTTYLFGKGAIAADISAFDEVKPGMTPGSTWGIEFGRSALGSTSSLVNRRRHIMHLRGVKWDDAYELAGPTPTNAEYEDGDAWARVYNPKNIRIVEFKHNLA